MIEVKQNKTVTTYCVVPQVEMSENRESRSESPVPAKTLPVVETVQPAAVSDGTALAVRDLSVSFGEHQVLKRVSLDIPARATRVSAGRRKLSILKFS